MREIDQEQESLEARVIRGYRDETLTPRQAREMLGLSRYQFDGFLKERQIEDHAYGIEELDMDLRSLNLLLLGERNFINSRDPHNGHQASY